MSVGFDKFQEQEVKVTISDGRIVLGYLWCLDYLENLVLVEATEISPKGVPE